MERALGVDLGEVRVGIAISDELNMMAHPLETIHAARQDPVRRIVELVNEKSVAAVVVGMPRRMDGSEGPAALKSREFAEALRSAVACRVVLWDERLTTVSAVRQLREAGRKARDQRQIVDQVAAQILLQSWLDAQSVASHGSAGSETGLDDFMRADSPPDVDSKRHLRRQKRCS